MTPKNKQLRIQVKTVKTGDWPLNAKSFLDFDENKFNKDIQYIIGTKTFKEDEFFVFVLIGEYGKDRFFILSKEELIKIIKEKYSSYLETKKGIRPRNPKTTHTAIKLMYLEKYENAWDSLK